MILSTNLTSATFRKFSLLVLLTWILSFGSVYARDSAEENSAEENSAEENSAEENSQEDMYVEVDQLLKQGYSPEAIYNHEISKGYAIYTIVDAAVQSDPDREAEFKHLAAFVLENGLPKSACGGNYHSETDWRSITSDQLLDHTIAEVARAYFEEGVQITELLENGSHGDFSVSELNESLETLKWWDTGFRRFLRHLSTIAN